VIGAAEVRGVAAIRTAQGDAAMTAGVRENANRAMLVADHDHRVDAKAKDIVPRLGDLALVCEKQPRALEDLLVFLAEDVRISIGATLHVEVTIAIGD
jgi:hypothetical protein